MKPREIGELVFQELLHVTLKRPVRSMGSDKARYLEELRTDLMLALKEMVSESAAFEDISFDGEVTILNASLANLNFVFEEVSKGENLNLRVLLHKKRILR
jgi:hypothetical protein